jgi:hypothetical protein
MSTAAQTDRTIDVTDCFMTLVSFFLSGCLYSLGNYN